MRKYYDPKIKIASFLSENVVTTSGEDTKYITEVDTLIGRMSPEAYKARVETVTKLLQFQQ